MLTAVIATLVIGASADARTHKHRRGAVDASGNAATCTVHSRKTGASARVGCSHVSAFQGYLDDLEAGGATIYFVGGIRRGRCWSGGMHPCGKAIDVCQLSRGRVAAKCHLPGRQAIAAIAARHGLFEGGQWCHSDYGHAQAGVSAAACSTTLTAKSKHRRRGVRQASVVQVQTVDRLTIR